MTENTLPTTHLTDYTLPAHTPTPAPKPNRALLLGLAGALVAGGLIGYVLPHQAPESCVEAIEAADEAFSITVDTLSHVEDAFAAAASFNTSAMSAASDRIGTEGEKIGPVAERYNAAKEECK